MTKRVRLWYLSPLVITIILIALAFVLNQEDSVELWEAAGLLAWAQLLVAKLKQGMDLTNPRQFVYYGFVPLLLAGPFGLWFVTAKLAPRIKGGSVATNCSAG